MPLQIVRNDITKMECEAIVNAANSTLLGGGGVDGAIHKAAGNELFEECLTLGGCKTGEAKITKGYNLPAKYVIHTVGPVWQGGNSGERDLLYSCYENSLKLAKEKECSSVAFPLISSGVYGYPVEKAFRVAVEAITSFLLDNDMLVYIVVYGSRAKAVSSKLFSNIAEYIDDNYVEEHTAPNEMSRVYMDACSYNAPLSSVRASADLPKAASFESDSLGEIIESMIDESFSQMLLRKIDEKNLTDSQCYKRANVDRRLFSKIRSNTQYRPSKPTALAFAIALELSLEETNELLTKAGYVLSHSSKFDIIIEYFIKNKNYNIYEINEALFSFDQVLLG